MNQLVIAETGIRQDEQGRYCLNDLHKAAGGEPKHQPSNWLRLDSTKALGTEIINSSDMRNIPTAIGSGRMGGTFVCKEMVYAYAMWISPAFSLQVIRTFDAVQNALVVAPISNPMQALEAFFAVARQQQEQLVEVTNRMDVLEAKAITRDESYFTAAGYCNLKGIRLDKAGMLMIGRLAANYSRANGLKIGKVYDSRYGEVNEYHTEALQAAVKPEGE